jgi:hypothetical protein
MSILVEALGWATERDLERVRVDYSELSVHDHLNKGKKIIEKITEYSCLTLTLPVASLHFWTANEQFSKLK